MRELRSCGSVRAGGSNVPGYSEGTASLKCAGTPSNSTRVLFGTPSADLAPAPTFELALSCQASAPRLVLASKSWTNSCTHSSPSPGEYLGARRIRYAVICASTREFPAAVVLESPTRSDSNRQPAALCPILPSTTVCFAATQLAGRTVGVGRRPTSNASQRIAAYATPTVRGRGR